MYEEVLVTSYFAKEARPGEKTYHRERVSAG
jgi:hypothetical protein